MNKNIPTILIIFGTTGDLVTKKILPALFSLFTKEELPTMFKIVGFSREKLSDEDFEKYIFEATAKYRNADIKICEAFCKFFSYKQGVFEKLGDFHDLEKRLKTIDKEWGVCTNKLFYLAVPPQFYEVIFKNLAASGLTKSCSQEEGWTRVLVEKPFGKNLETAKQLEKLLSSLFKEIQIYRIDHYLAKEMLQNILAFRFSNNLFEINWGKQLIESINIRLLEKVGVEDRGSFYDSVGALRDVGENHLLQMLALITMERPVEFNADIIRKKRAEVFKTLAAPSLAFRAQYKGYRNIQGVSATSQTETYFKTRAFLTHPRWRGVPIILESGKRLKNQIKEIEVVFRHPIPCFCPQNENVHYKNKLIIQLEPAERVTIHFWAKREGSEMALEERTFDFRLRHREHKIQYTEEYEKLLLDSIAGDQTLFVSSEEVGAMWRFIDPIIDAWQKNLVPLKSYTPDTDAILTDSQFVDVLNKEIGVIGLGKMGKNMVLRLREKGWKVFGFDKGSAAEKNADTLNDLADKLTKPRLIWLMIPSGKPVEETLFGKDGLVNFLDKGDIIIDGGNSFYKDSIARFKKLKKRGIHFIDAGISGGPEGARYGSSIMVGGEKNLFKKLETLFYDLSRDGSYQFFGGVGAGHFVKMVHNGIEYGMMQAIAEGFTILKKAKYKLNLSEAVQAYNQGSVIESRLIGWLQKAFELHGDDLKDVIGSVARTGEGDWTVKTVQEMKLKTKVIKEALKFRIKSGKNPSYTGKILSALREQFGGHKVIKLK